MSEDELAFLPALELGERIHRKELSPVEATEFFLATIERLDPVLGAFITVAAESALDAARQAESCDCDSPFCGVPVAIKDSTRTEGIRTTLGSAVFRDHVPDVDDEVVRRLKAAGFIVIGKTTVSREPREEERQAARRGDVCTRIRHDLTAYGQGCRRDSREIRRIPICPGRGLLDLGRQS